MVIKNYLYNLTYQILNILLPVITIPYISRILGVEGIGKYALTNAYAQYFVLFGMLGLSIYSSREIAYVRDDRKKLSNTFWEINFLRFITMGIAMIFYIIVFILINKQDRHIYIMQSLIIISSLFDISWLFIGLENFKKVVIRNTMVKVIGVFLIFMFVKNDSQVWLYALILGSTQLIGQIFMWFEIPKEIKFIYPQKNKMIKHLKLSIKLFIPQVAISVYVVFDKAMLGALSNTTQVGLYDNAQKIIIIMSTIVTSLSTVTVPKMANLYENKKYKELSQDAYKCFSFVSFISFPMTFGLIGACRSFVPWFFGDGFGDIQIILYYAAWLLITLGWSSIIGNQILISIRREKQFTFAVIIGAIVNVVLNLVLIKKYQAVGTTIAYVIAEYLGMFIMIYFSKDIVKVGKLFRSIPKYFISAAIMCSIVWGIGIKLKPTIETTVIQVFIGGFIYLMIMIITKDENIKYALKFMKSRRNKILNNVNKVEK